jgi:predicted small secreted protein
MKKKTLLLSALVLVVLALEGCATLRGIGEDIPHISLPRIPPNDFVKPAPVKRIFFCKLHSFAYGTRNIVFDHPSKSGSLRENLWIGQRVWLIRGNDKTISTPVFPRLAATSVSLTLQIEPYNSALLSEPSPNIKAETGPEIVTRTPLDYLELSETDKLSVTFQIKAGDDEILRRFFWLPVIFFKNCLLLDSNP